MPAPGDYDGEIGEMMIGRETEVLGENLSQCRFVYHKTPPVWTRTRVAAVGSKQLTAGATARPCRHLSNFTVITTTISEDVILVLLIEGIYEVFC
jgi:hypothetical protein